MNIHKWFSRLFLGSREIELLDHCPVETSAPDWREAKVIQAAQRFGKPFSSNIRIKRMTAPSSRLIEINGRAKGNYMTVIKE